MIDTDVNNEQSSDNEKVLDQNYNNSDGVVCKFRFVSGTYIGCALDLKEEEYYFGNTSDCDIVCGTNSEKTEVKITVTTNGKVVVCLLLGKALINRQAIPLDESIELEQGQVLSIGTDCLMWQSDWSNFSEDWLFMSQKELNELRENIALSAESENNQKNDAHSEGENDLSFSEDKSEDTSELDKGSDREESNIEESKNDNAEANSSKNSRSIKILVVVGLIVLLSLVFLMNWGYLLKNDDGKGEADSFLTLEEYVSNYQDGQLSVVDKGYSYIVRGVLPNQESLNQFISQLPANNVTPIELNIELISDLQNSLNQTFASYGITVSSVYTNNGFEVYGYIHDSILEAEIVNKVEQDFRGYSHVIPKMKYYVDIDKILKDKLSSLELKADYKFGRGLIAYNGNFSLDALEKLQSIKKYIMSYVNGPVIFTPYDRLPLDEEKYIAKNTEESSKEDNGKKINKITPPQNVNYNKNVEEFSVKSIVGINLSPMSFITTKNGAKYFEGAKLPNGFIIKKIERNAIVITKDNQEQRLEIK